MGQLRRLTPLSDDWGFDRGRPVDRFYIDDWFGRHAGRDDYSRGLISGRILEVGDSEYTRRFGRAVEVADVLHVSSANPQATVVADLTDPNAPLPADYYDCVICTQTLHVIYDSRAAIRALHRCLKPGGFMLATVPGITRACVPDRDLWGDWWRYTASSARRQVEEIFGPGQVCVESYGNVLTATAFLYGLAAEELRRQELHARDPNFEVVIGIRAQKSSPAVGSVARSIPA
jgi:SAM-dependent methyltransferase